MRNLFHVLFFAALFAAAAVGFAQEDNGVPDEAREEIIRRGNLATHSLQSSVAGQADDVIGMPADDSHKWFVTMITSRGCSACERLKADWKASPHLQAWARPGDQAESWAHYNEFVHGDRTQDWRWEGIKIAAYPTILIQPPRSGQFGNPATLVWQFSGYSGDPEKLSAAMANAVRAYIAKQQYRQQKSGYVHTGLQADTEGIEQSPGEGDIAIDPPFPLTPVTPTPATPAWPFPTTPTTPTVPTVPTNPTLPAAMTMLLQVLTGLLAGGGTTNLLLIALIGVQLWRAFRKATGQPLLLDDATFENLKRIVSDLVQPAK